MYLQEIKQRELIPPDDINEIFCDIDVIQQMHNTLYTDLKPLFAPVEEAPAAEGTIHIHSCAAI